MDRMIDRLIDDIRDLISEALEENPDAPETDVTREVVECMILGEDETTRRRVRKRFGLIW